MKKVFKIIGIVIVLVVIIGAVFWQRLYFTGALLFFSGEHCSAQLCDTEIRSYTLPATNPSFVDDVTHEGIRYALPFAVATSSVGETVVWVSEGAESDPTDKIVIIFSDPYASVNNLLSSNGTRESGPIARSLDRVGTDMTDRYTEYELTQAALAITPERIDYFVSFDRLVEQMLLVMAKSTIFYEEHIYAVENDMWQGFVLVGGSSTGIEVVLFDRTNDTLVVNFHTNNLSLEEVVAMVDAVAPVDD